MFECVSIWNKDVSPLCEIYSVNKDMEPLLYDCRLVECIWKKIGPFLKIDVTWKVIILGFYHEIDDKTFFVNNLLSFIGLSMFIYKMKCRVMKEKMSEQDLLHKLENIQWYNIHDTQQGQHNLYWKK